MRVKIHMTSETPLVLPINYNYILQAVVLRWLGDSSYQKFIHDTGFAYERRVYKLYSFSRLDGQYEIDKAKKNIVFLNGANLTVTSLDNAFMQYLVNNIISNDSFEILGSKVHIDGIEFKSERISPPVRIKTLSPIVTYSTLTSESIKKTYYFNPYEKEFSKMLRENLLRKYTAIYGSKPEDDSFSISILKNKSIKESVLIYKGTVIKGWSGSFMLDGSNELINIAYDAGLGSKNSQGFGCIEIF